MEIDLRSSVFFIGSSTWKERIVAMCLEKRIALYSPHTTWDSVRGGVTDWLAKAISDAESKVILPGAGTETKTDVGHGRLVELNTPITLTDAIERVKRHTGIKHVHVSIGINSSLTTNIKSYAVCAGAGNSVLKGVVADLYITGKPVIDLCWRHKRKRNSNFSNLCVPQEKCLIMKYWTQLRIMSTSFCAITATQNVAIWSISKTF